MSNVVINDLSKLTDRDDCIRFVDKKVSISIPVETGDRIKVKLQNVELAPATFGYIFDGNVDGRGRVAINGDSGAWLLSGMSADEPSFTGDGEYWFTASSSFTIETIGSRYTIASFLIGDMCTFEVQNKHLYIQNGDFGNLTLVDHIGSADGTLDNLEMWWKEGIDEVFPDQNVYKATWIPPLAPQTVYDTVGNLPPTGDASWDGEPVTVILVTTGGNYINNTLRLELSLKI